MTPDERAELEALADRVRPECEARISYHPQRPVKCERPYGHAGVHSSDTAGVIWTTG